MAKLSGGILGTVSGKVAGVVAGQWKDKNYVRQYAKPSNPNTVAQQTQRGKFGECVAFAKLLVGQVLNVFVDPFQKSMSGFNWFIKQNIDAFEGDVTFSNILMTDGKLYMPEVNEPTLSSGKIRVTFPTDLGANGSNSDKMYAVAYDEEIGSMHFCSVRTLRSEGVIEVPVPAWTGPKSWRVWVFTSKYDAGNVLLQVSRSVTHGATITP